MRYFLIIALIMTGCFNDSTRVDVAQESSSESGAHPSSQNSSDEISSSESMSIAQALSLSSSLLESSSIAVSSSEIESSSIAVSSSEIESSSIAVSSSEIESSSIAVRSSEVESSSIEVSSSQELSSSIAVSSSSESVGSVTFVLFWEPQSQWINNSAGQAAIRAMLDQFEATLRTSGPWDAEIEVFVNDDENQKYATAGPGSRHSVTVDEKMYSAGNPWTQIVQDSVNPNGVIDPNTGENADIIVSWNFNRSLPESNPGLFRHEMMHALGMLSHLGHYAGSITWPYGGAISKPVAGSQTFGAIYDAQLVDLDGKSLLGEYDPLTGIFEITDWAIDSDFGDANGSGLAFRGIDDSGAPMDMILTSMNPTAGSDGMVDLSHVSIVSYSYIHPTWDTIAEVDRAFFRGMGYTVVVP